MVPFTLALLASAWAAPGDTRIVEIQGGLLYLTAHPFPVRDFNVVLRPDRDDPSQQWRVTELEDGLVTMMQVSTGRYLDAHVESPRLGYRVVTRPRQTFDDTQLWRITESDSGSATIEHAVTGMFLEPILAAAAGFQVVLRPGRPGDELQTWTITEPY